MPRTAAAEPSATAPADRLIGPVSEDGRQVSEEVYWRDYYPEDDILYEWNNGRLEEMPMSDQETLLAYVWLLTLLGRYLESHPVGQIVTPDFGFRLALPSGVRIRRPDCAVVLDGNQRPIGLRDNSYHGIYDLCIEALSDLSLAGIRRDTVTKKAEYAAGGVPEYYILHRDPAYRAFYSLSGSGGYSPIPPQDGVIASSVLPGFRFRIADLDARPRLPDLIADPVYTGFVLPEWQQDRERAEAEAAARRAEAAKRREAEQRAEAESAKRREAEAQLNALSERLTRLEARLEPGQDKS
jgi:Uma2 family endonuclease